jgi:hypothetical protein
VHTARNNMRAELSGMLRRAVYVACVTDTKNFYKILEVTRALSQAADRKIIAYKEQKPG